MGGGRGARLREVEICRRENAERQKRNAQFIENAEGARGLLVVTSQKENQLEPADKNEIDNGQSGAPPV